MVQPTYVWTVNDIDVTSYTTTQSNITRVQSNENTDTCEVYLVNGFESIVTPVVGQNVLVTRGEVTNTDYYEFRGTIKKIKILNTGIKLICFPPLDSFKTLLFTQSYDKNIDVEAGEGSAIAQSIIEDGGKVADVTPTGTGSSDIVLNKFISKRKTRFNRLKTLAQIYDYVIRDDYENETMVFEPEGNITFGTTLTVGVNVYNNLVWEEEVISMRNSLYIDGAFEEDTRIDKFNGDGSKTVFGLNYEPIAIKVTVGGVLQKLGVEEGSATYDYILDKQLKNISFEVAPGVGTDNVVAEYTAKIPYTSYGRNETSISQYNVIQEDSYTFDDISTVADSESRLGSLLQKIGFADVKTVIETDVRGIIPGMFINIEDPQNTDRNGTYLVHKININYGSPNDKITVGTYVFDITEFYQNINQRLKALEGDKDAFNEIIRQILLITHFEDYDRYDIKVDSKDQVGTAIYGSPVLGIYGTSEYGDNGEPFVEEYSKTYWG